MCPASPLDKIWPRLRPGADAILTELPGNTLSGVKTNPSDGRSSRSRGQRPRPRGTGPGPPGLRSLPRSSTRRRRVPPRHRPWPARCDPEQAVKHEWIRGWVGDIAHHRVQVGGLQAQRRHRESHPLDGSDQQTHLDGHPRPGPRRYGADIAGPTLGDENAHTRPLCCNRSMRRPPTARKPPPIGHPRPSTTCCRRRRSCSLPARWRRRPWRAGRPAPSCNHQPPGELVASIAGGLPPSAPRSWSGGRFGGWPGDLLLVGDSVGQAAMQDADQPIAQGPERLMMGLAAGPVGVIAAPRPPRGYIQEDVRPRQSMRLRPGSELQPRGCAPQRPAS